MSFEDIISGVGEAYQAPEKAYVPFRERDFTVEELRRIYEEQGYDKYRETKHWRGVVARTLARDKFACRLNVSHTQKLAVHHRTYENIGCEKDEDVFTMCETCHSNQHFRLPPSIEVTKKYIGEYEVKETQEPVASRSPGKARTIPSRMTRTKQKEEVPMKEVPEVPMTGPAKVDNLAVANDLLERALNRPPDHETERSMAIAMRFLRRDSAIVAAPTEKPAPAPATPTETGNDKVKDQMLVNARKPRSHGTLVPNWTVQVDALGDVRKAEFAKACLNWKAQVDAGESPSPSGAQIEAKYGLTNQSGLSAKGTIVNAFLMRNGAIKSFRRTNDEKLSDDHVTVLLDAVASGEYRLVQSVRKIMTKSEEPHGYPRKTVYPKYEAFKDLVASADKHQAAKKPIEEFAPRIGGVDKNDAKLIRQIRAPGGGGKLVKDAYEKLHMLRLYEEHGREGQYREDERGKVTFDLEWSRRR